MITISRLLWLPLLTGSLAAQTETIVSLQINSDYEQEIVFFLRLEGRHESGAPICVCGQSRGRAWGHDHHV